MTARKLEAEKSLLSAVKKMSLGWNFGCALALCVRPNFGNGILALGLCRTCHDASCC
jgi:hypothetical protein